MRWWIRLNRRLLWFHDDEHSNNYVLLILDLRLRCSLLDSASCHKKIVAPISIFLEAVTHSDTSRRIYPCIIYFVVDWMHGAQRKNAYASTLGMAMSHAFHEAYMSERKSRMEEALGLLIQMGSLNHAHSKLATRGCAGYLDELIISAPTEKTYACLMPLPHPSIPAHASRISQRHCVPAPYCSGIVTRGGG